MSHAKISIVRNGIEMFIRSKDLWKIFIQISLITFGLEYSYAQSRLEGATPIPVGEGNLFISSSFGFSSNDNTFLSSNAEQSSEGVFFEPRLLFETEKGSARFQAVYDGALGEFSDPILDFLNHDFQARGSVGLSNRLNVGGSLGVLRRNIEVGSDPTQLIINEPVSIQDARFELFARYGARNARGNLRGRIRFFDHTRSRSEFLVNQTSEDFFLVEPSIELGIRLSPDTRFVLGTRFGVFDFSESSLDRSISTFLLGIELSPTGKLSGSARIGLARTFFDDDTNTDTNEVILESAIDYEISRISSIRLEADRRLDNQDGSGIDFTTAGVIFDDFSISWSHSWRPRFSTTLTAALLSVERDCPGTSADRITYSLNTRFTISRKVSLGVSASRDSRNGDICSDSPDETDAPDYDRLITRVNLRVLL